MKLAHLLFKQVRLIDLSSSCKELKSHIEVILEHCLFSLTQLRYSLETKGVWVFIHLLQSDLEEDLANAHPEAAEYLPYIDIIEEPFLAIEHLIENIIELML